MNTYGPAPPLYHYGGPVKSVENVLKGLGSKEIKINWISPPTKDNNLRFKSLDNISIYYVAHPLKYILKNNVVHWFNSFFDPTLIILLLLRKNSTIISPRGQLSKEAIKTKRKTLKKFFIQTIKVLKPKHFHVTSEEEYRDIKAFFPKSKIDRITNISNISYRENYNFKGKILYFSRISKKKRVLELLELIDQYSIPLKIDFYGYADDKAYLEQCLDLIDKHDFLSYKGQISSGNILEISENYTYFILPTLNENFGHSIVESISAGLIPIITKGTTPFDKSLEKYFEFNFTLDRLDLERLCNKIITINHSELKALKQNTFIFYTEYSLSKQIAIKDYFEMFKYRYRQLIK